MLLKTNDDRKTVLRGYFGRGTNLTNSRCINSYWFLKEAMQARPDCRFNV